MNTAAPRTQHRRLSTLLPAMALAAAIAAAGAGPLRAEAVFTGVFGRGDDAFQLWALPSWQELEAKWRQAGKQGLRLAALRTYLQGGRRFYAGAWRPGGEAGGLAAGLNAGAFVARNPELAPPRLHRL